MDIWTLLTILTLACFVGYFVVWGVTPALHSPLMSVSNAISGIVIVGALITAGISEFNDSKTMGLIAVFLAAINIFGGFAVSHRMLLMFKKKKIKNWQKEHYVLLKNLSNHKKRPALHMRTAGLFLFKQ